MKIIIILIALSNLYMSIGISNTHFEPSKAEQEVNKILKRSVLDIEKKYPLRNCGNGASMPGGSIKELSLSFNAKRTFSKEELRELLLQSSAILMQNINDNQEVQKSLSIKPFTQKNVQIKIIIQS